MILVGDVREKLRDLADESVQCCVTSPPYWGLRDYGTATWAGGDAECDHQPRSASRATRPAGGLEGGKATVDAGTVQRDCHCGATRIDSQLGLEPTPEEYVANMVEVFRGVRRALKPGGTLWLNLGDSYTSGGRDSRDPGRSKLHPAFVDWKRGDRPPTPPGLKPKDLVGIPWLVAFALQADGWYLRSDIIWAKPNPMPESVTDRPTKAHEYLFLLAKSERYYYDAAAIAEPSVGGRGQDEQWQPVPTRNARTVWTIATRPYPEAHFATFPEALVEPCILAGTRKGDTVLDPFAGSGTTLAVAKRLDRDWIGIELNPEYAKLAERRLERSARQIALEGIA